MTTKSYELKCIVKLRTMASKHEFKKKNTQCELLVNLVMQFHYEYGYTVHLKNSVDPDQLAS